MFRFNMSSRFLSQSVSLEIAYNLGESLSIWIFSMDYVFLAIGFGISSFLAFRYGLFNAWHAVIGGTNDLCAVLLLLVNLMFFLF